MTPETTFGEIIRRLRKALGLSQEELAFLCGLDRTFIGMVERGERSPSLNSIMKLAKHLNVPVSTIILEMEQMLQEFEEDK